jgi:carbamoyltransferase
MLILGLNAFHPDSAACVLRDGKLVAAMAEERLGPRRTWQLRTIGLSSEYEER